MAQQTRVLNDRYEVRAPLGRGGMAEVYRGTDRVLGRPVAIKILDRRYTTDAKFVTRFRREAQSAAGINDGNVVSVYDTGSEDGIHYIVMEFVDGETLDDLLHREGPLSPERAVAIAEPVAQALEAAHAKGMVHRDVKPGNIMLDRGGHVKVVDFGIARAAADDTLTQTGTVLGTAAYLSPEQAQGAPVDPRSDVYSLGCVLYEMLTGSQPFTGDSPVAIAYKHVREDPAPPSRLNPDVPPQLEAVVIRAMAKDPGDRFPSGGAMREALSAAATGELPAVAADEPPGGDTAVMTTVPETEQASPTRPASRWLPWAVIGAILVALAILGFLALRGPDQAADRGAAPAERGPQTAQPPPTEEPVTPVGEAYGNLLAVLGEGVAAEEVSQKVADEIGKNAGEALRASAAADEEKAAQEINEAYTKMLEGIQHGEISSGERVAEIESAIENLASTMGVTISAPEEEAPDGGDEDDEGSGAPGRSEDRGKGKGEGKGKGKGED